VPDETAKLIISAEDRTADTFRRVAQRIGQQNKLNAQQERDLAKYGTSLK
jgi:hypothetical protein